MDRAAFDRWLAGRPECVRLLAKEFPLHTPVWVGRLKAWYVIGWTEDDGLLLSPKTLEEDYEQAMARRQRVCAGHYR